MMKLKRDLLIGWGLLAVVLLYGLYRLVFGGADVLTLAERKMLACKGNLYSLELLSRGRGVETLQPWPAWLKCPSAGRNSYRVRGSEVFCEGHHHADAGLPADYPRWTPQRGVQQDEPGNLKFPTGFPFPIPGDAVLERTFAQADGAVIVIYQTGEDLGELAEGIHEVGNPGAVFVQAANDGVFYVRGEIEGCPYWVTLDTPRRRVEAHYQPAWLAE